MINQYFDKVYLLNLHKREDRLIQSTKRLDNFNIKFDKFGATDGSVMSLIWNRFNNQYFTSPNYLACCISHLSIYKDALTKGYKKILIIEDDVLINKNINSIFDLVNIPEWEDLLYLGYIPLSDDQTMWDYSLTNPIGNVFVPNNLWGLFSYGISNGLMSEIINIYDNSFPMELDRYFVNHIQPRGKSIALAPQLFCCQDIFSDNMNQYQYDMIRRSVDSRFANYEDYI